MKNEPIPITIAIAESRLNGFRFAAKHHDLKLEDLLAYRLMTEIECLHDCGILQSLERMELRKTSDTRKVFTILLNNEALALIKRVCLLLNRNFSTFSGELLDSAGDLISNQVAEFLSENEDDDFFMDTRKDTLVFKELMTAGKLEVEGRDNLWKRMMISRDVAFAQ